MIQLLIVLNLCHWAADYTWLSRPWMLRAKSTGLPLSPILAHAAVHAILMGGSAWMMVDYRVAITVAAIQLPTHFAIDVMKGRINTWFPSVTDVSKYPHWMVFGADQFLHHLVIILTAWTCAT